MVSGSQSSGSQSSLRGGGGRVEQGEELGTHAVALRGCAPYANHVRTTRGRRGAAPTAPWLWGPPTEGGTGGQGVGLFPPNRLRTRVHFQGSSEMPCPDSLPPAGSRGPFSSRPLGPSWK